MNEMTAEYKAFLAANRYPVNEGEKLRGVDAVVLPMGSDDAIRRLIRDVEVFGFGMGQATPYSAESVQWFERSAVARAKLLQHIEFLRAAHPLEGPK